MSTLQNPQQIIISGTTQPDLLPTFTANEYSALTLPAFYSAVRFISETLASLPKAVYRRTGTVREQIEHPVTRLMSRKINPFTTPIVVWETWIAHAVVHGNGYLHIRRAAGQQPQALTNIDPETVTPFRVLEGEAMGQWYQVRARGKNYILPASDVLHLPGLGFDGMCGYPVVQLMAETLELAKNTQKFGAKFLKKGTQLQGSIEIPAIATKEQVEQIQEGLRRNHTGIESQSSFVVLSGGATLKNTTLSPQSSQLLESMNFSVTDICRMLRVAPQHVYQLDRATWGNAEVMGMETVKYCLRSWIEKSEMELMSKLLTEREQDSGLYIRFDIDALLRGDTVQNEILVKQVNGGIRTANEARYLLDLPPDPDPTSNKLRVPVSFPVPSQTDKPQPTPTKNSASDPAAIFTAMTPALKAACERVETKSAKAFDNHKGKAGQERTIWSNVFAEEQKAYAIKSLTPVAQAIAGLGGQAPDVGEIAEKYAAEIRRRAATGETKTLSQILGLA